MKLKLNFFFFSVGVPSVDEVCSLFGLTDVQIEYSEDDYQNLTTYKLFQQHVRPLLAKDNPKVPIGKMMMLVAAKWRDFCNSNPNAEPPEEQQEEQEYSSSSSKPSRSARQSKVFEICTLFSKLFIDTRVLRCKNKVWCLFYY